MSHPYTSLPAEAFWRTAVAEPGADGIAGLWRPKWHISPENRLLTAGSCFAQHIGRNLAERGYAWTNAEPAPPYLRKFEEIRNGYGVFSFRTGNIYTPGMLNQWLGLAFSSWDVVPDLWEADGRHYDPMRPVIEPDGFASADELGDARAATLEAMRRALRRADVLVFTLGLTEHWVNTGTGFEYALCPGTTPGAAFDPSRHAFGNYDSASLRSAMEQAIGLLKAEAPQLRLLLTVSPVPLTATASGEHVLTATHWSKSALRAVAGELAAAHPHVDYFPSYEIITHPVFGGRFYADNMRSVTPDGVATVMRHFFAGLGEEDAPKRPAADPERRAARQRARQQDVQCEEELLGAFAK